MRSSVRFLLILTFAGFLLSCGGSGQPQSLEPSIKVPSPVTDYVLDIAYTDTLLPVMLDNLPPFLESTRFGKEQAISFSFARNIRISRITWVGKVAGNADITDATFILRFYGNDYTGTPTESAITEHFVTARAQLLHEDDPGSIYQFVYEDYAMFNEGAGNYWLAILDAEVDDFNVDLAATPEDYNGRYKALEREFGGSWFEQSRFVTVKLEGGPPVEYHP